MFPPTFIIKPHTSHKQYTTKYCLQILEEKNENGTGRIPDPSDFSEGVWSRETRLWLRDNVGVGIISKGRGRSVPVVPV